MMVEHRNKIAFACTKCHRMLVVDGAELRCESCDARYRREPFVDVLPYAEDAHTVSTSTHERIRMNEDLAMVHRAREFYAPEFAQHSPLAGLRVLDDGCGSGVLVDEFDAMGMEAWGIDPFNRWNSWQQRTRPDRLARADGMDLPFEDGVFDVVVSNGVLEHVGHGGPGEPATDKDAQRRMYIAEAIRVLRPGGLFLLAHPNGACPIDFWHGGVRSMRPHRPYESYMPNGIEVRRLVRSVDPGAKVKFLSPHKYVSWVRTSVDPLGRVLQPLARAVVTSVRRVPPLRSSPINPFLVSSITKSG